MHHKRWPAWRAGLSEANAAYSGQRTQYTVLAGSKGTAVGGTHEAEYR